MGYFTRAGIEGADRARGLQNILGISSYQHIINALSNNFIIKFAVLPDGLRSSHAIYGPSTAILKLKMVRKNPKHM